MNDQTMRGIPPVHRFLSDPRIQAYQALFGRATVKERITSTLDELRDGTAAVSSYETLRAAILESLEHKRAQGLLRVVNATGVLLHTNLGRAPLAASVLHELEDVTGGYSNLEYDLARGTRGSRYERANTVLRELTGAQDALVVNNCAAAVLLLLDTFAKGREVVIARNQLIEVGGGFRLPEVMQQSGATLVEVGASNKVYVHDFERAMTPRTALFMRTHSSNYRITGFTAEVEAPALVELGKRTGIPVIEDLGSGALVDTSQYGLPHERTVAEAIAQGVDAVAFSGDKLLGGPQAGIIVGSGAVIARLRDNPLMRALRVDKITLFLLIETLRLYLTTEARSTIPFFRMLSATPGELRERAERYLVAVPGAAVLSSTAYVGGGSLPEHGIPSIAVAIGGTHDVNRISVHLRRASTPIITRIEDGRVLLDVRTIAPEDDPYVISVLSALE